MKLNYLKPALWTAWRTYKTASNEARSIIANEKNHTKIFLDDETALLWGKIESGVSYNDLYAYAKELDVAEELDGLLEEFESLDLLNLPNTNLDETKPISVPEVKEFEYAENMKPEVEFQHWVMSQGFMYNTHWELTYRCNERCVHCYNPGAAHSNSETPNRTNNELSTEQVKATLKRLADAGVFTLTLSGGEIMLRKDFFEIVAAAREVGMSVNIYTNGLKLNEDTIEKLCKLYPSTVSFSIYSHIPEVHDDITRVPGSFEKTVSMLKEMNKRGIRTSLKSVQMSHTLRSYNGILNLAKDLNAAPETEIGLSAGVDGALAPMLMSIQNPAELIVALMTESFPMFVGTSENNYGEFVKNKKETVCSAGFAGLAFSADGSIYPCNSLPIKSGNLHEDNPVDIWNAAIKQRTKNTDAQKANFQKIIATLESEEKTKYLAAWQDIRLEDYEECGTHYRCHWCVKCPGMSMMETGRSLAPSTTNCRIANARMFAALLLRSGETRNSVAEKLNILKNYGELEPLKRVDIEEPSRAKEGYLDPRKSKNVMQKSDQNDSSQEYITPYGEVWLKYGSKWNVEALKSFEPIRELFEPLKVRID